MLWLALSAALAEEPKAPEDEVVRTLVDEMGRSMKGLDFADAPDIYHLRYHVMQMDQADAVASFGGLLRHDADPFNALGIELRVGGPAYDNTGFGGWQNGFSFGWLPSRLTPEALELELWRLTDRSYKQAVEQYARKKAQFTAPPDYPGDYLLTGPVTADLGKGKKVDGEGLQKLAQDVSGAFLMGETLERGEVHLGQESGAHWIVDSEGTRVVRPVEECTLRALVHVRAPDGALLTDERLWTVSTPDQLPPADEMKKQAREMAEALVAVAKAPVLEEEYVGPVLFEDEATLDLFRYLLVPQLEGTPAEVPFEAWFGDLSAAGGGSVRIGRRVLPMGWTVHDDPKAHPDHPSSFENDMEGTPAQDVTLVTDGIVRTLLMSRVPRQELVGSNGHARGSLGDRASGRVAQLEVTPGEATSAKKVHKAAVKLARSYGRDWYVVVRRLQEPAVLSAGGGGMMLLGGGGDDSSALPPPVALVRVYADGREEVLRGAQFAGVHRWVLRDVVAAGDRVEGSFMASSEGSGNNTSSPTEGLPTWISAPEVLIGEMELVPAPGDPRDVPLVPPPSPVRATSAAAP
jgi:TldD protein